MMRESGVDERSLNERQSLSSMPLSSQQISFRFVGFAGIATLANLAAQEFFVRVIPAAPLMVSILAGTAIGFFVKYILDKWYVFYDAYDNAADEARKVTIYALCSVATTLIFWAVEVAAWQIWGTSVAKYSGAIVGLAIGYLIKYRLDVRFVFKRPAHD